MSKHRNGTKAAFIDKNAQNAMKIADETTAISVFDGKNVKNDEKSQNVTKPADEVTEEKFSDDKNVKNEENGQNPTCSCGEIEAENLALRAEIAGLRGELDALRTREGELVRELGERSVPDYAAIAADESFADEYACRSEIIKAKVITDYLRSLSHTGGVRLLGEKVGRSALAPLTKPKTLSEAKKLAELYIKD